MSNDKPSGRYYGKLVRDRIPEIIRQEGHTPFLRHADGAEFMQGAREKLLEEAAELFGVLGEAADANEYR